MTHHRIETQALLTPAEVAELFRVDPKTVTRWANSGKLTSLRTPGGHRRYKESEVRYLLGGSVSAIATWGADVKGDGRNLETGPVLASARGWMRGHDPTMP